MKNCTQLPLGQQVEWLRKQFAQSDALAFSEVLPRDLILGILTDLGVRFHNSLYNPVTTVWLFLSQVISADPSLAATVERFLAWRLDQQLPPCDTNTGAYSHARSRLPEGVLSRLVRHTGTALDAAAPLEWLWRGRHVKLFDGSTVSMSDTGPNQAAYPQPRSQKPGVGFPLARIGVLFSLSVGSALDAATCKFRGKFQSELGLLRMMFDRFDCGDVLLTDRYLCSYLEIAVLGTRGVDILSRMHAQRKVDFRRGRKLGVLDHVVIWAKPPRPEWMSQEQYAALPAAMAMRELRYRVLVPGFRPGEIVLATTLLNAELYSNDDLADLYGMRWDAEINLRSLKTMMRMEVLRGETPEMVRKEIWGHLLAYNLIRTVMAQAALVHGVQPRRLSFTRAMRTIESFRPTLAHASARALPGIYEELLKAVASHKVGDRPGRKEPRRVKRRPKPYPRMTTTREQARRFPETKS